MKAKRLLSSSLLMFVAVSLAMAVGNVIRGQVGDSSPPEATGERMVLYDFHTRTRCDTCRTIEALGHEAVRDAIASGRVEWRVINYQEPENRHFAKQFGLEFTILVLAEYRDGQAIRWKKLDRVWELYDDPPAFRDYVRNELAAWRNLEP